MFRNDLLSFRSASTFHASCEWFRPGWTVVLSLGGQRFSSLIEGRILMVLLRRPRGASRSGVESASRCPAITDRGSLGEEPDFLEVCPRPAQPTTPPSAVAPTATEATEKGWSWPVRWTRRCQGTECPEERDFLPAPPRGTRAEAHGLQARGFVRRRRRPSERERSEAETTGEASILESDPFTKFHVSVPRLQDPGPGEEGPKRATREDVVFAKCCRSEGWIGPQSLCSGSRSERERPVGLNENDFIV